MNQALLNARDVALQFVGTLDGQVVDEAATEGFLSPGLVPGSISTSSRCRVW
nr:hypothetical protein [Marinicella sp. W31]MDC2875657.1 hypothetical protein [Marinicella sp. W31]